MPDDFQNNLQDSVQDSPSNEEIIKEIEASNEKDYLSELKKKNKGFLIDLTLLERERIAKYICDRYNNRKEKHNNLCDEIDEYDSVFRMQRQEVVGSDGEMPNYRTPLSTVTLEVVHANIMNVFFTPKDIMQVIPTEQGDIAKVQKLSTFGNWSADNELSIFEKCDRLFHSSAKNGECPYMVHWVKEYGTEIKREVLRNPANPIEPLVDPDTQEPLYQEIEEQKLLYNAPKLEIISRKDYIQPDDAVMDSIPEWEMRRIRMTYDDYLRDELQGKMYKGSIKEIKDWSSGDEEDSQKEDYEGDMIPVGDYKKQFIEFYGRMRISVIKRDAENETEEFQELEDEFIAIVNVESEVLCQLRKNKFPLKMRPLGMDYFIPDDEGRRAGTGIIKFLENQQRAYDALFNQYIFGTIQSNNPAGFFTPLGNMKNEPIKIKNGYLFPTADPSSVNIIQLPAPNQSLGLVLEMISNWAQLLFGISDYAAGVESQIDPTAPAKKAELVVSQGNVRLNMIVKRKNKTLQDIFKRWFLLYKDNMPPNKFMRIVGDSEDNPWKFEPISLEDFALKSLPDFELTGNVLNVNKTLEANKAISIYQLLIGNPFFAPQTQPGLQALNQLTKWLIDKLEETGLSRFLPKVPGDMVHTPEEENARFLQGDMIEPLESEDHVHHLNIHRMFLQDPNVPEEIKTGIIAPHIKATIDMMQKIMTQQMVMSHQPQQMPQQGMNNAVPTGTNNIAGRAAQVVLPGQPAGMA